MWHISRRAAAIAGAATIAVAIAVGVAHVSTATQDADAPSVTADPLPGTQPASTPDQRAAAWEAHLREAFPGQDFEVANVTGADRDGATVWSATAVATEGELAGVGFDVRYDAAGGTWSSTLPVAARLTGLMEDAGREAEGVGLPDGASLTLAVEGAADWMVADDDASDVDDGDAAGRCRVVAQLHGTDGAADAEARLRDALGGIGFAEVVVREDDAT